jgi:hypothetical protein
MLEPLPGTACKRLLQRTPLAVRRLDQAAPGCGDLTRPLLDAELERCIGDGGARDGGHRGEEFRCHDALTEQAGGWLDQPAVPRGSA